MKLNRHEIRTCLFLLLYQKDFYPDERYEEQQDIFLDEEKKEEELEDYDRLYIESEMARIIPLLPEIDGKIEAASKSWKLNRIAKAELAILRLGVYEIIYADDAEVPVKVAIDEAVELAREYGQEKGYAFVNGVLDTISSTGDK
ncbi:MAG: transcription antitermination factor NusB [Eubacterium sp.]|nr:transcription antitermination factor NusB [Eubacterium sp.]